MRRKQENYRLSSIKWTINSKVNDTQMQMCQIMKNLLNMYLAFHFLYQRQCKPLAFSPSLWFISIQFPCPESPFGDFNQLKIFIFLVSLLQKNKMSMKISFAVFHHKLLPDLTLYHYSLSHYFGIRHSSYKFYLKFVAFKPWSPFISIFFLHCTQNLASHRTKEKYQ